MCEKYLALIITTSDRAQFNPSYNLTGHYLMSEIQKLPYMEYYDEIVVPDVKERVVETIREEMGKEKLALIITSGGTGMSPKDQTPDATQSLYDKSCPGIATALMVKSLEQTPHAALSRLTAGIIHKTLVVNFPGKLRACQQCFEALRPILKHALDQINNKHTEIVKTHKEQDSMIESVHKFKDHHLTAGLDKLSTIYPTTSQITNHFVIDPDSGQPKIDNSYALVEYIEALRMLKKQAIYHPGFDTEYCSLYGFERKYVPAVGEILANNVTSLKNVPSHSVSTMDGFILNITENMNEKLLKPGTIDATLVSNLNEFELRQESEQHRDTFFCYQVNTGGRVPTKNFAVVPFENTGPAKLKGLIPIYKVDRGKYVRKEASDISTEYVMPKGTKLGPVEISTLISMGHSFVDKVTKPLIGILSTGDEIIDGSLSSNRVSRIRKSSKVSSQKSPPVDKVVDTNGPMLASLFTQYGIESLYIGVVNDHPEQLNAAILNYIDECDILIITGAASMGTSDHVKFILKSKFGVKIQFGRVNIKPGKPAGFGILDGGWRARFVFSLPGNPVSAYVTSLLLVIPFIRYGMLDILKMKCPENEMEILGTIIKVEIGLLEDLDGDEGQSYEFDGRLEFARAKFCGRPKDERASHMVSVSAKQQSSRLISLVNFDCLILVEPSKKGSRFAIGQVYDAVILKDCII